MPGPESDNATVAVGAVFTIVTGSVVKAEPSSEPSPGVSRTEIWSPLSPLPETERSRLAPVSPVRSVAFLIHW